jgi:hypothetical protein
VPGDAPAARKPDNGSIEAIAVLLLLQLPPAVVSVSVLVVPTHKLVMPVIIDGALFTVTGNTALQPAGKL